LEGRFLSHILAVAGREVRYVYIRTRDEFEEMLDQFEDSNFRYLHISCHGSETGLKLTLDHLSIRNLKKSLAPCLENRLCGIATPALAEALLCDTGCYSVVGPSADIEFGEAAVFWAALYYVLFRDEAKSVSRKALGSAIAKVSGALDARVEYFACSVSAAEGFTKVN